MEALLLIQRRRNGRERQNGSKVESRERIRGLGTEPNCCLSGEGLWKKSTHGREHRLQTGDARMAFVQGQRQCFLDYKEIQYVPVHLVADYQRLGSL